MSTHTKSLILIFILAAFHYISLEGLQRPFSASSNGNCSDFFGHRLVLQCEGKITKTLLRDFPDKHALENTPFSIFSPDIHMLSVLVTMFNSPLMYCKNITVEATDSFDCDDNANIVLGYSKMYCFHYPLRYFAALRDTCRGVANPAFNAIANSALHYADSGCTGTLSADDKLMLITISIMLVTIALKRGKWMQYKTRNTAAEASCDLHD